MLASERLYLATYLEPLAEFLARTDVTDVYVNRPGEVWLETLHGTHERHDVPDLTGTVLARLARQIASYGSQGISREHPLLATSLPDGARVQIAVPPATRGEVALAVRRHVAAGLGLEAYSRGSAPSATFQTGPDAGGELVPAGAGDEVVALLGEAVRERRNILVSGGTSTGKTTFLGALLREIPPHERLVYIEDTPELPMTHANAVGLLAARGSMGEARITMEDLLVASLRMRPDRIILGEVRGAEALTFLRAANTGHPGSMTSIHADSPARAIEQLALLVLQTGSRMAWQDVIEYITRSLDFVVQLERVAGRRTIAGVLARARTRSRGTGEGGLAVA
jgi:type IV secretion system protein VirB11